MHGALAMPVLRRWLVPPCLLPMMALLVLLVLLMLFELLVLLMPLIPRAILRGVGVPLALAREPWRPTGGLRAVCQLQCLVFSWLWWSPRLLLVMWPGGTSCGMLGRVLLQFYRLQLVVGGCDSLAALR